MASGFTVNDRRGQRTATSSSPIITRNLNSEMSRLRTAGHSLPKSNVQARQETARITDSVNNRTLSSEMGRRRSATMARTASNVQMALPKNRRPMSSLEDKGIPFDTSDEKQLKEIRRWCRLFYTTHDLIPLLIDIYSKFPVVGLEFDSKDPAIKKFYETMFFDNLDYENFLQDLGREYFISGEVNSLAHFDDTLGIFSAEEILNPDQLRVSKSMFRKGERVQLLVKELVENLRGGPDGMIGVGDNNMTESEKLEQNWEYQQLVQNYPELIQAAATNDGLDISDALISRVVNKVQPWDLRGTPHLVRSFRTLMMEESLNAAQDAVADRLYSPFILATLGIPNLDGEPWVPDQEELDNTRDDMQSALAADFRLMVHNFGLDVKSVFGRESVPRFDTDYSRIDKKLMSAWGIGEALISGSSGGGAYASSALNREFVTQMMLSYQNSVKRHILKRCEVIAEAQEHFDYDTSGSGREPVYREIVDPESGELRKVPKLLLPEIKFQSLNLRDEVQERNFLQSLKNMGVPISDGALAVNIPIDFDQELERQSEEKVNKWLAEAQAMKKTAELLKEKGLPMPPGLAKEMAAQAQLDKEQAMANQAEENAKKTKTDKETADISKDILEETGALPSGSRGNNTPGSSGPNDMDNGISNSLADGDDTETSTPKPDAAPRNRSRPAESDEQRKSQPKAANWTFGQDPSSWKTSEKADEGRIKAAVDRLAQGSPRVRDLVESEEFYATLNQHDNKFDGSFFDSIEAFHFDPKDDSRISNRATASSREEVRVAHRELEEMLEQFQMVTGYTPVWE